MRFSTALALCAAPLAMAGTHQERLLRRTEQLAVAQMIERSPKDGGSGNTIVQVQSGGGRDRVESVSITEIIVLWVNNGGGATTSTNAAAQTVAPPPSAATHMVTVGGAAGLVYSPETISAAVGDTVIFTFQSANHTATQSAFAEPCVKLEGGMDSGFMANINDTVVPPPQMAMQVTVATPIWFYCRQKGHCGKGMTFSINPTAEKTQAMFKAMAIAQNGTGTLAPIQGGAAASAAPAAAPPAAAPSAAPPAAAAPAAAASAAPAAAAPAQIASGTGQQQNGACTCSCFCGVAAFPAAAVQGIGGFGGMSGSMPMAMLEI